MSAKRLHWAALALFAASCRTSLDPDVNPNRDGGGFHCANDSDCGAGWHCNDACPASDFTPVCLPNTEGCDPCPDLLSDPSHCGSCATACTSGQTCVNGGCVGQ